RAESDGTLGEDMAAALFDDAINGRQAQSASFSLPFGREEWLRNPNQCNQVHSAAGVANFDQDARTSDAIRRAHQSAFGFGYVSGLDRQSPPFGHRVPCIDCQVDNDLLNLARIGFHSAQALHGVSDQLDIFTYQTAKHLVHVCYNDVQIEDLWLQELLAAKSEQLPRKRCCPFPGFTDLSDVLVNRIVLSQMHQCQIRIAVDCGKQIVEVVSTPAGQSADGVHLLGLAEFFLELMRPRNVPRNQGRSDYHACRVSDRRDRQ